MDQQMSNKATSGGLAQTLIAVFDKHRLAEDTDAADDEFEDRLNEIGWSGRLPWALSRSSSRSP